MKLEIQLDADRVAPGQALDGRILVHEGGVSRTVTLTVSFCERSPATMSIVFSQDAILHEGDLETGQALEFGFRLPDWALPSVRGKHGELFWRLDVVSDEPGPDTRATRVFEVATPVA